MLREGTELAASSTLTMYSNRGSGQREGRTRENVWFAETYAGERSGRQPRPNPLVQTAGLTGMGRAEEESGRAPSSSAALVPDLEDNTRLGGVLRRRNVRAINRTTVRGMQPRIIRRRAGAGHFVGVWLALTFSSRFQSAERKTPDQGEHRVQHRRQQQSMFRCYQAKP